MKPVSKIQRREGLGGGGEIFGHLEKGSMLFLDKDSDQVVALGRKGHLLGIHGSYEAVGGDPAVFLWLAPS